MVKWGCPYLIEMSEVATCGGIKFARLLVSVLVHIKRNMWTINL